jgi:hypothetical protein
MEASDLMRPRTGEDFESFSQWALIAFSAMCVRRVQPLFALAADGILKKYARFFDDLITLAEETSATGKLPDVNLDKILEIVEEAVELTGGTEAAVGVPKPRQYAYAAVSVVQDMLGQMKEPNPLLAAATSNMTTASSGFFMSPNSNEVSPDFISNVYINYRVFKDLSKAQDGPIPRDKFPPLWPNNPPEGWVIPETSGTKEEYLDRIIAFIRDYETLDIGEDLGTNLLSENVVKEDSYTVVTFVAPVAKESVLIGDIHDINDLSSSVIEKLNNSGEIQLWNLTISGYDDDPRILCEIPEVRLWCKKAHANAPYLPCILTDHSIAWYLPCIFEIEIEEKYKRQLSQAEQSAIDKVVNEVAKQDLKAAANMKQSMELGFRYRIKSQEEIYRFSIEVSNGILDLFKGTCLSQERIMQVAVDTGERIGRILNAGTHS